MLLFAKLLFTNRRKEGKGSSVVKRVPNCPSRPEYLFYCEAMSMSMKCVDVPITETVYTSSIVNGYVVLFFFLCFFIAFIGVIIFAKYVISQMRKERLREKESKQRKTQRVAATSRAESSIFDEPVTQGPLPTNYVGLPQKANNFSSREGNLDVSERSQSCISFVILDGINQFRRSPSSQEATVAEVLGSLFTSNKNSLPPTIMNQCCSPLVDIFQLIYGFNQEAFTGILDLMLTSLLQQRRVSEARRLEIMTKYEQIFVETIPGDISSKYTSKMHFVLAMLKSEMTNGLSFQSNKDEKKIQAITIDLAKYMCSFQKEMISESYNKNIFEVFVMREYGLANCIIEKWMSLELIRYRMNIIYDSTNSMLKKNKRPTDVCNRILNKYIRNVFETLCKHCKDYEDNLSSFIEHVKRESSNNLKQNLMEIDVQRTEKRCHFINDLESFSRKAVTNFFMSQNEAFLESSKAVMDIMLLIDSDSIKNLTQFQKINDKKLMRSLKLCEENLFSSCQHEEVVSDADLMEISKEMTILLKDFRAAHQDIKNELLTSYENNINRSSNILQKIYEALQEKYLQSMDDLKGVCLETLHALSNLQEEDMDDIELEFEIAFWSMNFNSYFSIMCEITNRIHAAIENSMKNGLAKDISYSLEDMNQILKQDKGVLSRPSLFSKPDPSFYQKVETDLFNEISSFSTLIDEYLSEISVKLNKLILTQCSETIHKTKKHQSAAYFSNFCVAKDGLRKCNTDSRGYTSKLGSSLVRSCNQKLREIWQSQFDFKSMKLKENFKSVMNDYSFKSIQYFENSKVNSPMDDVMESFEETFNLEYSAYFTFEKLDKSNAVKTVLDANLENEFMIEKFGEKINALNSTFCESSDNGLNNSLGKLSGKLKKRKEKSTTKNKKEHFELSEKSKLNPLLASSKQKTMKKKLLDVQ